MRLELIQVIADAQHAGIHKEQTCTLLRINLRRIERWETRMRNTGTIEYAKPGPRYPDHAIVPAERSVLLEFVGREETVDYSFQMLALKGAEQGLFFMSASSVRSILMDAELASDRIDRRRTGVTGKPNRPDTLTGPNQCWCWDISYLKTDIKRVFWYLYVMLDEWSRKVIAWRVSASLAQEEARMLIDDAIIAENLLEAPSERMPVVVNDRGSQMKAKEVKQMFTDLGLTQTFSRPSTPNDNPFIEALFSTTKRAPTYPGWFPSNDSSGVDRYFGRYFNWYNDEHYHSRIGYVTPNQKHDGQADEIIRKRKKQLTAQRHRRKQYWLSQSLIGGGL